MRTASSPETIVAEYASYCEAKRDIDEEPLAFNEWQEAEAFFAMAFESRRMSDAEYLTWLQNVRAVVSANQRESALVILRQSTGRIVKGGVR